jgi:hypothetical protein
MIIKSESFVAGIIVLIFVLWFLMWFTAKQRCQETTLIDKKK